MTDIKKILSGVLDPSNYGYLSYLSKPVHRRGKNSKFVGIRKAQPKAFDCLDAAIIAQDKLREHGMSSNIWRGFDEAGFWDGGHYFNVLEEGGIVDLTPPFPLVGAKHGAISQFRQHAVKKHKKITEHILGKGLFPVSCGYEMGNFYLTIVGAQELNSEKVDRLAAESNIENRFTVQYNVVMFSNGKASRDYIHKIQVDRTHSLKIASKAKGIYETAPFGGFVSMGVITEEQKFLNGKKEVHPSQLVDAMRVAEREIDYVRQFTMNLLRPIEEHP